MALVSMFLCNQSYASHGRDFLLWVTILNSSAALESSVRRVSEYSSSFIDLEDHPYLGIGVSLRDKLSLRRVKTTTHN